MDYFSVAGVVVGVVLVIAGFGGLYFYTPTAKEVSRDTHPTRFRVLFSMIAVGGLVLFVSGGMLFGIDSP